MVRDVNVSTKKAFSLVEFLVSLVILTIISVALLNSIVFFMHKSLERKVVYLTSKAIDELHSLKDKVKNCTSADACDAFNDPDCENSLNCNSSYCTDSNKCVVCVPEGGKNFYYSFNASELENTDDYEAYKINICWKFGGSKGTKEEIIYFSK
jgi:prepilin-type N-terminal cleavage/methylation domain-containing protein